MRSTVFIINSPLHYLFSLSILKKIQKENNYFILWFGNEPIANYFPNPEILVKNHIIDLSHFEFNHYPGYIKYYDKFISLLINKIRKIDYLFTCYDTHYGFEVIRHHFSVKWEKIGIIEDGTANYFPNRMPTLNKQLIKSILNKLNYSFFFNVSRLNLGGNPKIGFISTLSPKNVYIHPRSKAKIIDISRIFKNILNNYSFEIPQIYKSAEVIIFLSAVLYYNRMSDKELITYLKWAMSLNELSDYRNILIKAHPREDLEKLSLIINENFNNITLMTESSSPMEIFYSSIKPRILMGMPTTAMLNHYFISTGKKAKYILLPTEKYTGYTKQILGILKDIILDDISIINYRSD